MRRARATRSETVVTTIPSSTRRAHAATRARLPSTSTTQSRHAAAGVRVSR